MVFASYGIWEDFAAFKVLLQGVAVICLQFWDFLNDPKSRRVNNSAVAGFGPKLHATTKIYQPKLRPAKLRGSHWLLLPMCGFRP